MARFSYKIQDELGIHARPAGQLIKLTSGFASDILIKSEKGEADAKRLIAVMKLGVTKGQTVEFIIHGSDEADAEKALREFVTTNL